MTDRIRRAGSLAWAGVGLVAMLAVVALVAWTFRVIFPPLILAGAIVFILNPVVTALQRRHVPRVGGTAISYLGVIGVLVLLGFLVSPLIQRQADDLSEQWPELRQQLEDDIDELSARSKENDWFIQFPSVQEIEDQLGGEDDDAFTREFDDVVGSAAEELEDIDQDVLAADLDRVAAEARNRFPTEGGLSQRIDQVREIGERVFELGLIFILGPIIAFYLLVDLPHLRRVAEQLVPERAKPEVLLVSRRLNTAIGGFFRGQLLVAFIVGVMVSVGLAILDLPFWLIVGMIAGFFNLIPLIGPWVGAVPGIVIALTTRDVGTAVWVAGIMAGAQQIDNHFISPLVMQRTVHLHPAVVMLALLAGGTLGGFFGLLMAVPVTAVLKIVLGHLWRTYVLGEPLEAVEAEFDADERKPAVGIVEKIGDEDADLLPDGTRVVPPPPEAAAEDDAPVGQGGKVAGP